MSGHTFIGYCSSCGENCLRLGDDEKYGDPYDYLDPYDYGEDRDDNDE